MLEENPFGGVTIQYNEGPKRGLAVHFYSAAELAERTKDAFEPIMAPRQDVIRRAPPETGTWAQWEAIWRKRSMIDLPASFESLLAGADSDLGPR